MNKIYLIRHGKTRANEEHLYCGSTDLPLSENGKAELEKIKYDIDVENTVFITSGMRRTKETLETLFGDVPHYTDTRFREIDFGIFELKSYEQLKDNAEYKKWLDGDNFANIPPQGESGEQMKKRVLEAFSEVTECGKDVAIITHGGVIAAVMEHLFADENKSIYQWQPQNGRGYLLENNTYAVLQTRIL